MSRTAIRFEEEAAAALAAWSRGCEDSDAGFGVEPDLAAVAEAPAGTVLNAEQRVFAGARRRARRLGATVVPDDAGGVVEFGFWAQDLHVRQVPDERLRLEVFVPLGEVDPTLPRQVARFLRLRLPLRRDGAFLWSAVRGLPVGSRERFGALYWLAFADEHGSWSTRPDPLGASYPFGAFAPAEVYDVAALHAGRADADYFRRFADGHVAPRRFEQPANVLQLHVATATAGGTVASLTRMLQRVAAKREAGERLTPFELCLSEYDAIQPLPLEPTIEREHGPAPWSPTVSADAPDPDAPCEVTVDLRRPDVTDWGYDVAFVGMGATNAALLESARPDELVDLAVALHTLPGGPMMLVLDLVYGHTDDQSLPYLDPAFFRGPNMYGQDVNQQHPVVRAIMLEMQRRRVDVGADGIRVDGAQDIKTFDPVSGTLAHDDEYLLLMGELVQEVAGVRYRPWCVFEDGRPWPREDWPTASTYRDVTERQPHVFQWGPLTFAHNTPALLGFWWDRWWRVEEILSVGERWISGCANHDTVRRGIQLDPNGPINRRLGTTLPQVLRRAYDHPAGTLLTYVAFPGVPMDFLNATARAPWGFVRDTDDRFVVKVAAEEAGFLEWQVEPDGFAAPDAFRHLKALGFDELAPLQRAFRALEAEVASGAQLVDVAERVAPLLPRALGRPVRVETLERVARAFMADAVAWCNVERHAASVDEAASAFGAKVRALRRARPWLASALAASEQCRAQRRDGATLVDALRCSPDGAERLWLVANLEGETVDVELNGAQGPAGAWRVLLVSPGAVVDEAATRARLPDGEGVVLAGR